MPKRRRRHRSLEPGVVDAVELELEEQEIAGKRGHAFLRVAMELRARCVARVGRIDERSVGHDAPGQILQRLVGAHRRGERLAPLGLIGERDELAAISFREFLGFPPRAFEIGGEARRIHALIKIVEPPLRQLSEIGRRRRARHSGVHGMERQAHRRKPL